METPAEHARAVARRVLTLRILGLVLLLFVFGVEKTDLARKYIALCAGCALMQLAHLDFPPPSRGTPWISVMELTHPQTYFWLFVTVKILALASLGVELWAGFHFLTWKTALFVLIGTTVGMDLLATRLPFVATGALGLVVAVISVAALIFPFVATGALGSLLAVISVAALILFFLFPMRNWHSVVGFGLLFLIPLGLMELLGAGSWPAGFSWWRRLTMWTASLLGGLAWAGVFERELPLSHGLVWTIVFTTIFAAATSSLLSPVGWVAPPVVMIIVGLLLAWANRSRKG